MVVVSASATLHGALAAVPTILVAVAAAALVVGDDRVLASSRHLADALPAAQGAPAAVEHLTAAGLRAGPWVLVFAVVAASAYGEGLARALVRLVPESHRERQPPAWWRRVLTLPLLGLAPLTLAALLLAAPVLTVLTGGGTGGTVLAVYLALNLVWVLTWAPLTWTFRVVAPGRPGWGAAMLGAVVTGAFVSGFLQGFVLFLALPVDLDRPFGGLPVVGVVSALLLWLWVLHAVVVAGYALTWELEARRT